MRKIFYLFIVVLILLPPTLSNALTARELQMVWHLYSLKLKDMGVACVFDKGDLRGMFSEMDITFPETTPRREFVLDRDRISSIEETDLDGKIPISFRNRFFANDRTNTRLTERDQVRRKMKLLALEAINEIRSPFTPPPMVDPPRTLLNLNR